MVILKESLIWKPVLPRERPLDSATVRIRPVVFTIPYTSSSAPRKTRVAERAKTAPLRFGSSFDVTPSHGGVVKLPLVMSLIVVSRYVKGPRLAFL